ncbi:MAG: hypothetical protein HY023_16960 [Chloroflexi bacterium]|nr:hypothetical protein [Chloroflexota bacterium]
MKPRLTFLALIGMALLASACSPATEAPLLGVTPGASLAPAASGAAVATDTPLPPPAPTDTPAPPPTVALPEGAILLPTLPRPGTDVPPSTPVQLFPAGALQATLTALPPATPDVAIYSAVYQSFEHGAMIYVAEFREIWVLVEAPGRRGGPYYRFADNFHDGDTEGIANLPVPPGLLQPHRGFGRIWREQPGLRQTLGWATNYELPFSARLAHLRAGAFDALGGFNASAGLWMMTLHDNSIAYFSEATNTWGIASNQ